MSNVIYRINGVDLKDYGVYVSASRGLFGQRKRRYTRFDFPGESGHEVDLKSKIYDERIITLDCFIKANDDIDLINKHELFTKAIVGIDDYATLEVTILTKKLIYKVYTQDITDIRKVWGEFCGDFTIKLIEP